MQLIALHAKLGCNVDLCFFVVRKGSLKKNGLYTVCYLLRLLPYYFKSIFVVFVALILLLMHVLQESKMMHQDRSRWA